MLKPVIITLLSPRYEFSYRMHDALLAHPTLSTEYEIQVVPYSPGDEEMPDLSHYNAAGIITALNAESEDMGKLVKHAPRVVNISDSRYPGTSSLYICPEYFGEVIVRHALGGGFKALAYLPTHGIVNQEHGQGRLFERLTKEAGLDYWQQSVSERPLGVGLEQWAGQHSSVIDKLVNSTERTLVYCFHDWRAETLLDILKERGVRVPEQIGVLGRGNSLNTRFGRPTISSFATPLLSIAQKAVELIQGDIDQEVRIAHGDIISRASTVGVNESHQLTEKLPKMIQEYGSEGITVDELATLVGVSRSTLERHYRMVHGEAPSVALKRVRMQHVEHLLRSTNLTISAVAEMVGFSSSSAFTSMFRHHHGVSPGRWRRSV